MSIPRGLRNNNPGNIRNSSTEWQGEITPSKDKFFKQFTSMAYGYRAVIKLLQNYRKLYHLKTVAELINRWAPPTENKTSAYIIRVCKEMQVPSTYVPDVADKDTMSKMILLSPPNKRAFFFNQKYSFLLFLYT